MATGILMLLLGLCPPQQPADNRIEYMKDAVFPKYSGVQMAEEGKLAKVIRQWPPLQRVELKSDEMLQKAIIGENADARKVRIGSLQLVYYDNGTGIIEPAIRVVGKIVQETTGVDRKNANISYNQWPYSRT